MRPALLRTLKKSRDTYVSGGKLAKTLSVSRNAIWKHIEALRSLGYKIEAVPRKGYRLVSVPDRLYPWELQHALPTNLLGHAIDYHESIPSTNERAKELAIAGCAEGQIVVAEEQTAGKGRLGRGWLSPFAQGVFVSLVIRPRHVVLADAPKFTLLSAVAVQRAIAQVCQLETKIKWPNDIEMEGKKLCGILVELGMEIDAIDYVIVGIGVNANIALDELPDDVKERATSLQEVVGHRIDRVKIVRSILHYFEQLYEQVAQHGFATVIELARRLSSTIGQHVRVLGQQEPWEGQAIHIDDDGSLCVRKRTGEVVRVQSGEVSIRAKHT